MYPNIYVDIFPESVIHLEIPTYHLLRPDNRGLRGIIGEDEAVPLPPPLQPSNLYIRMEERDVFEPLLVWVRPLFPGLSVTYPSTHLNPRLHPSSVQPLAYW